MAIKFVLSVVALLMVFLPSQFSAAVLNQYDAEEAAILAELEKSPLEEVDWNEVAQDSSELTQRFGFDDILHTLGDKCRCEDLVCYCFGTPKIVGISFDAWVNMTMFPSEKILGIGAGVADASVYRNISVTKLERLCGSLPGIILGRFKLCMYNTWIDSSDARAMTTCSSVDLDFMTTTVASIQFHCLELKNGKISFSIPADSTDRSAIASFKMKNPLKSLATWLKKKFSKKDGENTED